MSPLKISLISTVGSIPKSSIFGGSRTLDGGFSDWILILTNGLSIFGINFVPMDFRVVFGISPKSSVILIFGSIPKSFGFGGFNFGPDWLVLKPIGGVDSEPELRRKESSGSIPKSSGFGAIGESLENGDSSIDGGLGGLRPVNLGFESL